MRHKTTDFKTHLLLKLLGKIGKQQKYPYKEGGETASVELFQTI